MLDKKKTIIGVIGGVGSGKDTVADYISSKLSIPSFQISQVLKDFAKENNIEPTRENLINIGRDISQEKGNDFLSKMTMAKINSDKGIITGIRVLADIEYLRKNSNFILLSINTDPQIRFSRSITRNKLGEATTLEEFIEKEKKENFTSNFQRLFECMELADYSIENNDDIESLFRKVNEFLVKFKII